VQHHKHHRDSGYRDPDDQSAGDDRDLHFEGGGEGGEPLA
jgi:hypothetical protein